MIAGMTEKHVKSGLLAMVNVYIREAHPTDEWSLEMNDRAQICVAQTKTLKERLDAAISFHSFPGFKGTAAEDIPLVVDDPATRALDHAYEAVPERLVLVDKDFNVVFRSGQGPWQYDQAGMLAAVEAYAAKYAPALAASPVAAKL